jgi:glutathione peroxidase
MTIKQQLLKTFYPFLMWLTGLKNKQAKIKVNEQMKKPATSLYSLTTLQINNTELLLEQLKGKKMLLVNTASDCGYTNQYKALEKLHKQFDGKLVVLGFPANDFKEQEKDTDENIASFCKVNYGITFPLMKKSHVVKGAEQNPVFNWLSDANKNGWNNQAPVWNFCKYLVNEEGMLTHYFDPSVSPLSQEVLKAIE